MLRALNAALFVSLAGLAHAQPDAIPVWRMQVEYLEADRELVRTCLSTADAGCENIVQNACGAALDEDSRVPATERNCDWRAIAAWEDEMNASLVVLHARLSGRDGANLDASQRAWDKSMLADVGLGMDFYQSGSLAGPVGAHIRARATAVRAIYLYDIRMITDDQ